MKWIDVKDRLPKEEKRYAIIYKPKNKNPYVTLAWRLKRSFKKKYPTWHWKLTYAFGIKNITHWMELPELPKEKC